MNQPINTLPKPKPNNIPKDVNNKNNNEKNEKNKKKRTVKHLDHLFTKDFQF